MGTDKEALDEVDVDRLRAYLSSEVALGDTFDLSLLSGGRSNLTYLVGTGPYRYVVRRRPLGVTAAGAHDMGREYRVQAALQSTDLPVPRVHCFCPDDAIIGAPFYVMDQVSGHVFHEPADVSSVSPTQADGISAATIEVLDRLHRVDFAAVGLADLGRPGGFVARRISRWLDQWRAAQHRDHPLVEVLSRRLADSVPEQADSTLVHGDYRLGNMVVQPAASSPVAAVLDWEMSTLGDPLTDLAHLIVYWDSTKGRITHESQRIALQPGFWRAAALAEQYGDLSGRDLSNLDFYLAFEHWRAAIIKEGIYSRTRGTGDTAEVLGATVALHLEEAADILDGRSSAIT